MTPRSHWLLAIFALLLVVLLLFAPVYSPTYADGTPREPDLQVWEDGSFQIWLITGCIPFMPCELDCSGG